MKYKTKGYSTLYYKWLIGDLDTSKKRKRGKNVSTAN